jgi:hypothetical protein
MKSYLLQATTVWQAICLVAGALLGGPLHASMLDLDEYLQRAHASRQRGDWQSVASQMAQAVNHPDLPKTGDTRVKVLVGYAQAVGVLCQFDEASRYLQQALALSIRNRALQADVLDELGALHRAQQQPAQAADYLSQAAQVRQALPNAAPPLARVPYGARCPPR